MNNKELEELENEESEEVEDDNEESTETNSPKEEKPNASQQFIDTIKAYLDSYSVQDKVFAERYANPDKNIEQCCNYIINQVRKSGCMGFADAEIFKMARDYYVDDISEDDLQCDSSCNVVVNHQIELTEEEKAKAHDNALKQYETYLLEEMKRKARENAKKEKEAIKKEQEAKQKKIEKTGIEQLSLF